ncbi:hypothetical protein ACFXJ5_23500 [Streptomyces sp. NPDC059373]
MKRWQRKALEALPIPVGALVGEGVRQALGRPDDNVTFFVVFFVAAFICGLVIDSLVERFSSDEGDRVSRGVRGGC